MLRLPLTALTALALMWTAGAREVLAQGSGGSSSGGVQTVNAQSTASTTSGTGSQTGGNTSSQAGSTFGASSTGAGGQGGATQGGIQGPQFSAFGQGAATPASGFVGRGNTGTFVGNTSASQQSVNSGAFSRFGGIGGGQTPTGAANVSEARGGQMRIPQRIAFAIPPIVPAAIQLKLQSQFTSLQESFPGVAAQVDAAGVVTLQGSVADAEARRLAEALALVEPGVVQVKNELVVAP